MSAARTALVIGGGVAGPVAALALRRAGIQATVYEAHTGDAERRGLTLTLAPNGLEALRIVGAHEAVRSIGLPMRGQDVTDGRGRRIGAFPPVAGQPPVLALWRADLCRVLREQAEAHGVAFRYGARLAEVKEQPDGVLAEFADGSSASADILIGADGIRSRVRALVDPAAPQPRAFPLLNLGGLAACAAAASPDRLYFVFGRRGFFGYWAEPEGRTAWFANVPDASPFDRAAAATRTPQNWLAWLRDIYAEDVPAQQILANTDPAELAFVGPIESMPPVPTWFRGCLVLVGDAVHAPSPSSGQGASIAIESAIELARCLRDQPDPTSAFAHYQTLRQKRVAKIVTRGERTTSSKTVGPLGVSLMRLVMPLALRTFLNQERTLGPEQRFRIDWDKPAAVS
jgi:2-polyprenyl-6-methoxyphenol hydroxylase-like FAD-dependent oxidoreductase